MRIKSNNKGTTGNLAFGSKSSVWYQKRSCLLWSLLQKKVWLSISSVVGRRSVGNVVTSNVSSRNRSSPDSKFSYFRRKASAKVRSPSSWRLITATKSPLFSFCRMDSLTYSVTRSFDLKRAQSNLKIAQNGTKSTHLVTMYGMFADCCIKYVPLIH